MQPPAEFDMIKNKFGEQQFCFILVSLITTRFYNISSGAFGPGHCILIHEAMPKSGIAP